MSKFETVVWESHAYFPNRVWNDLVLQVTKLVTVILINRFRQKEYKLGVQILEGIFGVFSSLGKEESIR